MTHFYKITVLIIAVLFQFFLFTSSSNADEIVGCNNFTATPLAEPKPQTRREARDRLALINAAIKKGGEQILFSGDSLVERWSAESWDPNFGNRGTINAGVNGDRTYNLLWRLAHGSLDGPSVPIIIVLIGTNDLGDSSTPEMTADSIRQVLLLLRTKTPQTKILLSGLLPRTDWFGQKIEGVNRLIKTCANNEIMYSNAGESLLDPRLSDFIVPDGVHLNAAAYERLAGALKPQIDAIEQSLK